MLFGYPAEVATENWLHDSVVQAVESIHILVDAKKALPKWPEILPVNHREQLASRHGLKRNLIAYAKALKALQPNERKKVIDALRAQNKIPELLNREYDCDRLADLPASMHEPIKSLFNFAFSLLTEFKIRQQLYERLLSHIPSRICPFCGLELFRAPGGPQEDFDHYIPRRDYPFAAANLRNLPPMGGPCNTDYKGTQDPLRKLNGDRRRASDPYSTKGVKVSLDASEVDDKTAGPIVSKWAIEFNPTDEKIDTWDEIFHIRERWTNDILDVNFSDWLGDLKTYLLKRKTQLVNDEAIINAVKDLEEYYSQKGFRELAFLKAAVFRFVVFRCEQGCQRLLPILRDLVIPPKMVTPIPNP